LRSDSFVLDAAFELQIHDEILRDEPGLAGFTGPGFGGLESALLRVENWSTYAGLSDVFGIAARYAVAIARGIFSTMLTSVPPLLLL
jgi:death-on-curing protein